MLQLNVNQNRGLWWSLSAIAIVASIGAMIISFQQFGAPLRPGLDFVGGTKLQLELQCKTDNSCGAPLETQAVQAVLDGQDLGKSSVQVLDQYGLSIRTQTLDVEQRSTLQTLLNQEVGEFNPESIQIDTVGPSIGQELFVSGLLALVVSFFGIVVYLSFRFQFDYAIFAIAALFHDVVITAGVFALLGLTMGLEVDSLFLVALLTIIGFSVNDTVVIYDRIRETSQSGQYQSALDLVDDAVNQTLTRSINTTLTTLLPLVAIFLFGGITLKFFALALIVGFFLGSYSSIFIASTLLAAWRNGKPLAQSPEPPAETPAVGDDGSQV